MRDDVMKYLHAMSPEALNAIYAFLTFTIDHDAHDVCAFALSHIEGDKGECAQCTRAIIEHNA